MARTLVVGKVHLADILAGTRSRLHIGGCACGRATSDQRESNWSFSMRQTLYDIRRTPGEGTVAVALAQK
jgi:hypothetical protein